MDIAGVDIYHPTQSRLTGKEIAFGGDLTRSLKGGANYLVLETQAQGQPGWLPYPGQLRLQAYSHLASGADAVMYWHWHSIHNSFETYWRGLLSHDLEANPTYDEAGVVGGELARAGQSLLHLRKDNRVAVMVSNEALTALTWFTHRDRVPRARRRSSIGYNDVLRWVYDALFELNLECDFVSPDTEDLDRYAMVVVPALYTAPESTLRRLRDFVEAGGHLVSTFKSFVADEHVKVWADRQPHALTDVLGPHLQPVHPPGRRGAHPARRPGRLARRVGAADDLGAQRFMELLRPDGAEVLASYDHPAWGDYAAVTRHRFGAGTATHLGTMTGPALLREVLTLAARDASLWDWSQDLAGTVTVRRGVNAAGARITYFLNYSGDPVHLRQPCGRTVRPRRCRRRGGRRADHRAMGRADSRDVSLLGLTPRRFDRLSSPTSPCRRAWSGRRGGAGPAARSPRRRARPRPGRSRCRWCRGDRARARAGP